jgi:hypothetical protein
VRGLTFAPGASKVFWVMRTSGGLSALSWQRHQGAAALEPGCVPAARLRGARIVGRVDLMGATATSSLV